MRWPRTPPARSSAAAGKGGKPAARRTVQPVRTSAAGAASCRQRRQAPRRPACRPPPLLRVQNRRERARPLRVDLEPGFARREQTAARGAREGRRPDHVLPALRGGRRRPVRRRCGLPTAEAGRGGGGRLAGNVSPLRDRVRVGDCGESAGAPRAGAAAAVDALVVRPGGAGGRARCGSRPRALAAGGRRRARDPEAVRAPALGDGRGARAPGAAGGERNRPARADRRLRLERARRRRSCARRPRRARDPERRRDPFRGRPGGGPARSAVRGPPVAGEGDPRPRRGGPGDEARRRGRRAAAPPCPRGARLRPASRAASPVRARRRRRVPVAAGGVRRRVRGSDGARPIGRRLGGRRAARPRRRRRDGHARPAGGPPGPQGRARADARGPRPPPAPRRGRPRARLGAALVAASHRPDPRGLRGHLAYSPMSEVTEVVALDQRPLSRPLALVREYGLTLLVAAVAFVVAYDNGGFGESSRDMLSIAWASDAAGAYGEFTRVALYVAVFAITVVASTRGNAGRWADGLALGLVAVTVIALISRFFPGTFAQKDIPRFLPAGASRLSFPVGYWNGLAVLVAMAIPLLLRLAVIGRNPVVRGLALAPIPAIAATIYLTSSRAGVATAVVGAAAFLLFTAGRWAATGAVVVAGAGAVAAVLALLNRDALVNGPLGSAAASSEGKSAALIIGGVCILVGLLYGVGCRAMAGAQAPRPAAGWILLGIAVVAAVVGIVASHPVRRFEIFKNPTSQTTDPSQLQKHLLSASGNGRWQLWHSALDEFDSKPVVGRGAGSYEAWWLEHGSLPLFVQDAHSLYLETLGELGIVGFVLLVGTFLAALGTAARRLLRQPDDDRVLLASVTAAFVGYAVAAAVDWMWELTIVSVVAFGCLGLATGPATALVRRPRLVRPGEGLPLRARLGRYGLGAGIVVTGWLLICAIAIPLLSGARIQDSRDAAAGGDLRGAVNAARDARAIQPWSAEPDLQIALVEEQAGDYRAARRWIVRAISRDSTDWRLWFIKSRLETKLGAIRAARRSIDRARTLNPRSPVLKA